VACASDVTSGDRCFTQQTRRSRRCQDQPALCRTQKKHCYEAARPELELLFAETTKLIGDGCHVRRCLAGTLDLRRGGDVMRLKSRFRQVGQRVGSERAASGTADEVWRCEALGVRLDCNHLVQLRYRSGSAYRRGWPMARFAIALTCMGQDRHGFVPERRSLASSDVVRFETWRDIKESFVGYRWRSLSTHACSRCNPPVTITALRAIPVRRVTSLAESARERLVGPEELAT
jgi:hypothetical protein